MSTKIVTITVDLEVTVDTTDNDIYMTLMEAGYDVLNYVVEEDKE